MALILTKSNVDHLTEILVHGQGKWILYGDVDSLNFHHEAGYRHNCASRTLNYTFVLRN